MWYLWMHRYRPCRSEFPSRKCSSSWNVAETVWHRRKGSTGSKSLATTSLKRRRQNTFIFISLLVRIVLCWVVEGKCDIWIIPLKQESKILKFLGFMWNPLSWVMEAAAIMAIVLANGGVITTIKLSLLHQTLTSAFLPCRESLRIGKIFWVSLCCSLSTQPSVSLKKTTQAMLQLL